MPTILTYYSPIPQDLISSVLVSGFAQRCTLRGMMTVSRTKKKWEYRRQGLLWGYVVRCVPPLKGLRVTRAASVSYRASVPARHGGREEAPSYRALVPGGEKWSLSIKDLPGWEAISSTPPPFRHTIYRFWPRQATSVWRNLRQNPCNDGTFTFSAKEKDSETGLSYFGSRYYSSDLSIWLSVDPQSNKYAYQSGYVYCGNNPIKVVDPNGEDEWDLEKDGTLSQRPNGRTDVDIIHAKDKNGNNIERYYKAGTINYKAQCDEKYDNGVGWFTSDMMEFKDVETAMDFFEFAANNSDVEWALKISPTKNFVGTSHDPGFAKIDSPEGMTYDIHSHIDDPNKYMGSDHWRAMEYYNKGVTFNVYEVGKQSYATYNPTSFRLDGPRVISMLLEKKISLLKLILR